MPVGPVRKLALLAALSSELENASGGIAEAVINNTLSVAVGRGLDAVLFSANAATESGPAGLLFGVVPIIPTAGGGVSAMASDLRNLVSAIAAAGIDTSSVVLVCGASEALALTIAAGPHFSVRVIPSNVIAPGTVIAIATSALVIAGDGGNPQIDTSKQAVLHYADPASQIGTAGAPSLVAEPVISSFQTDTIALRCTAMITWAAAPGSVAVANGTTW